MPFSKKIALTLRQKLTNKITDFPNVEIKPSRYKDDIAFYIGRHEIAHFEGENSIDIRLGKKHIANLNTDDLMFRKRKSPSDWVQVQCKKSVDVTFVLGL